MRTYGRYHGCMSDDYAELKFDRIRVYLRMAQHDALDEEFGVRIGT